MIFRKYFLILIFLFVLIIVSFIFHTKHICNDVLYFNQKNELIREKVEFFSGLDFLYNNRIGNFVRKAFNKKFLSKIWSFYKSSWISKYEINGFIKKYKINVYEFLKSVKDFNSFNDFFIRELKPGARQIDNNVGLISPADSKLLVFPNISSDIEFFVKNEKFNLNTFLKDEIFADKYKDGTMLIFRLAPSDYHRYHFPCDCKTSKPKKINGILESVNSLVYKVGIQPLYENERQLIKLYSKKFGEFLFVCVGAMLVGKIVQTYKPECEYKQGEQIGFFEFGGSTIVLLLEKDAIKIKSRFIKNSAKGYETEVKMGQAISE